MKKQYFINGNIIDPHNSINEVGGLIVVVTIYFFIRSNSLFILDIYQQNV